MATETDLTGLGLPPSLATKLGFQPSQITAVGTTQSGSPTILSKNAIINATSSAQAVQLPTSADIGSTFWMFNPGTIGSAGSALIFVPSGHTLFCGAVNTVNGSATLTVAKGGIMFSPQLKQWHFIISQ
jgi:hypothetical protein